jgi:hypothetical protein
MRNIRPKRVKVVKGGYGDAGEQVYLAIKLENVQVSSKPRLKG